MSTSTSKRPLVDTCEILEHIPAVAFRLSHKEDNWRTLFVTQNISMYGYTPDEFYSGAATWLSLVHPDDRVAVSKTVHDYEAHNVDEFRLYYRIITKKGDSIPITEYNTVNHDANGAITSYDTVIVNSSAPVANEKVINNHYRQQIVLNDILMSLHDSDIDNALQIILDRTGEYLGTSRALLFKDSPNHKTCKVVYEWDNKGISSVMELDYSITYETGMPEIYRALQTTGSLLINYGHIPENCKEEFEAEGLIASAIFAVYLDGQHYGFVCFDDCVVERTWDEDTVRFLKNISNLISTVLARRQTADQLKQSRKTIEDLAFKDHLTKLPNRLSSDYDLQNAIEGAVKENKSGYLLFIDLDDFKIVNDCYGHDYGDAILISLADWLRDTFKAPHKVFRFGGDEFLVLLDYHQPVDIEALLHSMHERATRPWKSLDKEFHCTLSIGVVRYPGMDADSRTVVKQADIAMYEAKRQGKNRHSIYDDSLNASSMQRSHTEALLRKAMENNYEGFEIYYQPIVETKGGEITGAEALLRMKDGDTVLLPNDFLPLAEYLGFTVPIGDFVMRTAFAECKKINAAGLPHFKMCVNLSGKQLQQKDVLAKFGQILDEVGVDTRNVIVSITESTALEKPERIIDICNRLVEKGITITLDDFGGGSSSFLLLGRLPVSTLTTSRGLMDNIGDGYIREFLDLIIRLCHSMHKNVCINGIENEEQYQFCSQSNADSLQGFYLYNVNKASALRNLLG